MEKLVLRGIMYGADKIPDSWFEKVPGGFYKEKDKKGKQSDKDDKRRDKHEKSHRRRHSDEYEERRPRRDDPYDSDRPVHAPERRRRDADRSSYDGGDNNDSDEESQRRRARRSTINDADRYGYNDGFSRRDSTRRSYAPNDRPYESSPHGSQGSPQYADPYFNSAAKRNSVAAVAAGAGTAAVMASQQSQRHVSSMPPTITPVPSAFPAQNPGAASYVPYSDIYGANPTNGRQMFSPPPANSVSSVQPNSLNQVAPPNTYGSPPANGSYGSRRVSDSYHAPYNRQQDPYLSSSSHSPSFDIAGSEPRRARSDRRPNRDKERFQGKFMFCPSMWAKEDFGCVQGDQL